MSKIEIKPNIFWVGAKDWKLREFHGYKTQNGTTYNAYLIIDEKVVLVDTVKSPFFPEMLERIKDIIDPSKIDYIISNHTEMDHSGSIPQILSHAKNAELIASPNGEKGLKEHFFDSDLKIKPVKTGDELKIGKLTLQFINLPMIHWPDSMATYIPEKKLLLPNDAFGQHFTCDGYFDDEGPKEILFNEAAKYYANIVYPYSPQVKKALEALSTLDIDMIAPSHGLIWRTQLKEIISEYKKWSSNEAENKALLVYDTMWNSTEKLAKAISLAFEEAEIPCTLRSLSHSHYSDVITDVLKAKYVFIGSPVLNNEILPNMAAFLTYLKGLKPKNKIGFVFGSYGWAPKALDIIFETLKNLKWTLPQEPFKQKYRPKPEDEEKIKKLALSIINETK